MQNGSNRKSSRTHVTKIEREPVERQSSIGLWHVPRRRSSDYSKNFFENVERLISAICMQPKHRHMSTVFKSLLQAEDQSSIKASEEEIKNWSIKAKLQKLHWDYSKKTTSNERYWKAKGFPPAVRRPSTALKTEEKEAEEPIKRLS